MLFIYLTISKDLNYRTTTFFKKRKVTKQELLDAIRRVFNIYSSRSFKIVHLSGDGEFEKIRKDIQPVILTVSAPDDHVGVIERSIRTLKNDIRSHVHRLPFTHYTSNMIEGLITYSNIRRNDLPSINGVSTRLSPSTLVTGIPSPDYHDLMKLSFGSYVQTQELTDNTNKSRTVGAIALHPSETKAANWYFLSLLTGRKIYRNNWVKLPMTEDVIQRVNELAHAQNQPSIDSRLESYRGLNDGEFPEYHNDDNEVDNNNGLINLDRDLLNEEERSVDNREVDVEKESERSEVIEQDETHGDLNVLEEPDIEEEDRRIMDPLEEGTEEINTGNNIEVDCMMDENLNEEFEVGIHDVDNNSPQEDTLHDDVTVAHSNVSGSTDNIVEGVEVSLGDEYQDVIDDKTNNPSYDLRPRSIRVDYASLHKKGTSMLQIKGAHQPLRRPNMSGKKHSGKEVISRDTFKRIAAITMAQIKSAMKHEQVSLREGIKRYGELAVMAVLKEYAQLNDKKVFRPRKYESLTVQQRRAALRLVTIINLKRNGTVKGRVCADGSVQRRYVSKEDSSSPTVQLESLILTLLIDAVEGRDVATADIAGAYLFADMKDFVLIKLSGQSVRIMCETNPTYNKYVYYEGKNMVLYLQLAKALYGCLKSSLLWYDTFVRELHGMGFRINSYDPCVANMEINGSQCTMCWYVDDIKVSHIEPRIVTTVINKLENRFGKMKVSRGSEHTFVGMNFKINKDGTIKIGMKEYMRECINT